MHLIRTDGTYKLQRFDAPQEWRKPRPYAVLSHTWAKNNADEISFHDMNDVEKAMKKPGWEKVDETCEKAARDGIPYIWIDTCCIDKSGPHDQIQGEINSMYTYYEKAEVCYVHLADVPGSCPQLKDREMLKQVFPASKWTWQQHIERSRWFTRGWTLQELIAPKKVEFYNRRWKWIGSLRGGLLETISKTTLIPREALEKQSGAHLEDYTIAQRMSWAAHRRTTKQEDMAYCLLGLFNITLPAVPGEGIRAFERLQLEIIRRSKDHSIFAWNWRSGFPRKLDGNESLLAPHPKYFALHEPIVPLKDTRRDTYKREHTFEMTNGGLEITLPVLLDRTKPQGSKARLALLNCCFRNGKGQKERIALLVKEIDDGKSRKQTPLYEVYFESFSKPAANGEKEYTRLIRMAQKPDDPPAHKADLKIMLLNEFI